MRNIFDKNLKRLQNIREYGVFDGIAKSIGDNVNDMQQMYQDVISMFKHEYHTDASKLLPGDVIMVSRRLPYQHYAVYIGNNRVIHFAGSEGDFGGINNIHEAPFEEFLGKSKRFEVLKFDEERKEGLRLNGIPFVFLSSSLLPRIMNEWAEHSRNIKYHLYSPEETVQRAKDVVRDYESGNIDKYNLAFNNCEHFALWCKTGIGESKQVDNVLRLFSFPIEMKEYSLDQLEWDTDSSEE